MDHAYAATPTEATVGSPFPEPLLRRFMVRSGRAHLLLFVRSAHCSSCLAHIGTLVAQRARLAALNTEVVVVVPEGDAEARALAARRAVPFPVIAGQGAHSELGLAKVLFGVVQQSGAVVVDRHGDIALLHRATNPYAALDWPVCEARLAALGS